MTKQKYYAVKAGRQPGIYFTWDDCKAQVHGFPGALYKSFTSKEEAEVYLKGGSLQKEAALPPGKREGRHYDIYVDGSYYDKRFSWAFVVYDKEQVIHTASGAGTDGEAAVIHNVAGELEAAVQAIEWAKEQKADSITIYHDYIGISEWATGRWKANNKFTQAYAAFASAYTHWVSFRKVSGHSGIEGNELADKLAGEALQRNPAESRKGESE